jgi:hypothetical protein
MATLPMMSVASASGFFSSPPAWAAALRSSKAECSKAADQSRLLAIASGISTDRIQWLYGRKPFDREGHVSLVIDGWIVVDNGGLGRNLWNAAICPGNVCSLEDARRGLEESFLESASVAVRSEVAVGDWSVRIGSAK